MTGKGYKAKFKLIQFGRSIIKSIVRNKKTVKVSYKIASNKVGHAYLFVSAQKYNFDDENNTLRKSTSIELAPKTKSVAFKVKEGWDYGVELDTFYTISSKRSI